MYPALKKCAVSSELSRIIPARTNFTIGQYLAYLNPYSTESWGVNHGLVSGIDYDTQLKVYPASFPNRSKMFWRLPVDLSGGVFGYLQWTFGNYDSGVPAVSVPPLRVDAITEFTETAAYSMTGDTQWATILNEFYLTTTAGDLGTKTYEIAHVLHQSVQAKAFFDACTVIGTFTDPQDRVWQILNCGVNPAGALYIVFRPVSGDYIQGVIDKRAALNCLILRGFALSSLYVAGTALGVEPHLGSGSLELAQYRVDFNKSPRLFLVGNAGDYDTPVIGSEEPASLIYIGALDA